MFWGSEGKKEEFRTYAETLARGKNTKQPPPKNSLGFQEKEQGVLDMEVDRKRQEISINLLNRWEWKMEHWDCKKSLINAMLGTFSNCKVNDSTPSMSGFKHSELMFISLIN